MKHYFSMQSYLPQKEMRLKDSFENAGISFLHSPVTMTAKFTTDKKQRERKSGKSKFSP